MRIKKLNEFRDTSNNFEKVDLTDKKTIVRNRLSTIDIKSELKSKVEEISNIIDKL